MVADATQALVNFRPTLGQVITVIAILIPIAIVVAVAVLSYRAQWFRDAFLD